MLALILLGSSAHAATLPVGFTDTNLTTELGISPTSLAIRPDGSVLVAMQGGSVRVVREGVLLDDPAIELNVASTGERGLIGIALDPSFESNGYVYMHHTVRASNGTPAFNQVTRFTMTGDQIDPSSRLILTQLDPLGSTNHNGGAIEFGPDGQLYISTGDNDLGDAAQDLASRLGKILRIDPTTGAASAGNPFLNTAGAAPEVWALGLRNPFQIAFSPDSGDLFINDVGEKSREEINLGTAGANYGWPEEEGSGGTPSFVDPIYEYGRTGGACAITGGAFYGSSNQAFGASFGGDYFFADYCNGTIQVLDAETGEVSAFAAGLGSITDLAVGEDGELYYVTVEGWLGVIRGPFENVVPEPSLAALLAAGVLALGCRRIRPRA
jgi:glucose/arabinose dehydrogenase